MCFDATCVVTKVDIKQNTTNLIRYANQFGSSEFDPPLPLRRTFSLFRDYNFETFVCESKCLQIEQIMSVPPRDDSISHATRFESCVDYVKKIQTYYGKKFIKKECFTFSFFKDPFYEEKDIFSLSEDSIIGYCILQRDTLRGDEKVEEPPPYVIESILNLPEKRKDRFFVKNYRTHIQVLKRNFHIIGNYFSQQNNITNCCAQAATKMAIRAHYPDITAEKINKAVGITHETIKGNEGLKPKEFKKAITKLSGQNAKYFDARQFETPLHFLKLIYHAIESRFPVILLFGYETEKIFPARQKCHAAALIGHTFDKNTWWAYAWKAYFPKNYANPKYFPSVMWCDNFVIQDDNMGPYYLLPLQALKITDLPPKIPFRIRSFIQNFRFRLSKISSWFYRPLGCIITYPKNTVSPEMYLKIEPHMTQWLTSYNKYLEEDKNFSTDNFYFHEYFKKNLLDGSLVLRTFVCKKDEYLKAFEKNCNLEEKEELLKSFDFILNSEELGLSHIDFLYVVEISVPELYWINKKKIGEILINPEQFQKDPQKSVIFIKLPSIVDFFINGHKIMPYFTKEIDSRYDLTEIECSSCFS